MKNNSIGTLSCYSFRVCPIGIYRRRSGGLFGGRAVERLTTCQNVNMVFCSGLLWWRFGLALVVVVLILSAALVVLVVGGLVTIRRRFRLRLRGEVLCLTLVVFCFREHFPENLPKTPFLPLFFPWLSTTFFFAPVKVQRLYHSIDFILWYADIAKWSNYKPE